jgi:hypothetical protein
MKAGKELPAEQSEQLKLLEKTDPDTFDELAMRRRWSSVCKNPEIGMKQEQARLTLAPWPMVNHMSPTQVSYIVTNKILKLDQ